VIPIQPQPRENTFTGGGLLVETVLAPMPLSFEDVWLADAIKCPTHPYRERDVSCADTELSFAPCSTYLEEELERVAPRGVLTPGKPATQRTLQVLCRDEVVRDGLQQRLEERGGIPECVDFRLFPQFSEEKLPDP